MKELRTMSNVPTILVMFGITGDLARKKLIPALFSLFREGALPSRFRIVGFSRREMGMSEFHEYLKTILVMHSGQDVGSTAAFFERFSFIQGVFENRDDYRKLSAALEMIDDEWGMCSNKLFYCAVNPEFYQPIFRHLAATHLTDPCGDKGEGWTRVIVEKPFGKDTHTAQKLDELLGSLFKEEQIYRIDHYLAKEMLQNILLFRFANNLFEKSWSNETIEKITMRLWERIGLEDRGGFYDGVGALRDVGQNHLLQMLALVAMDRPANFGAAEVRDRRARLLETLIVPSRAEITKTTMRAQYEGYRTIKGVTQDSDTETYFRIRAYLDASRWKDIPIIMESGKRLGEQRKEIEVLFRHPVPCLCPVNSGMHYKNRVIFALEPEERITIHFWSKRPGFLTEMEERTFEFLLRDQERKGQYIEEYQKLLLDCIAGEQSLFVSTDEIKAMWRFIDPITRAWHAGAVPLASYRPDTYTFPEDNQAVSVLKRPVKEIGYIGLGKMGINMVARLLEHGWHVIAYDPDEASRAHARALGAETVDRMQDLPGLLKSPRLVWTMVPAFVRDAKGKTASEPVQEVIAGKNGLIRLLDKNDIVIDGGNSLYKDSIARGRVLAKHGIRFLDAGVSGGPHGARTGACIMVGGSESAFAECEHLFRDLSAYEGYARVGGSGAGHFVKMVHNGIEYGMMQAIAEGFSIMKKSSFKLDLGSIAELYNHGSVVESRLLGWVKKSYDAYGSDLKGSSGSVGHTGEGEWTVRAAKSLKVPAPVLEAAFKFRVDSKRLPSYTGKILSALRNQFGGHDIGKK